MNVIHIDIEAQIPTPITILHMSDIHFTPRCVAQIGNRIGKEIEQIQPDLILFSGDLIDHYKRYPQIQGEVEKLLHTMKARYGKYAVYGNHDIGGGAKAVYATIMKHAGFQVLCNQIQELPELSIALFGLDDSIAGYEDQTIVETRLQPFQILLSHEPDIADQMSLDTIELMLSGHTHGGQVYLPILSNHILPRGGKRYRKGLYHLQHTLLVVSSGIGTTKLPMRFRNIPEMIVYHLHASKDKL